MTETPRSLFWYYLAIGVIAGAVVVLPMYLALAWAAPIAAIGGLLIWFVDRLVFRGAQSPRSGFSRDQLPYVLGVAALLIGSMVLSWTVLRASGVYWVGWILGAVIAALVILLGTTHQKRARPSLQNLS